MPAPELIRCRVDRQLEACSDAARRLVEAASILGEDADLTTAGALAVVSEPLGALEEACLAGLLDQEQTRSTRLSFPDPLVKAAVYEQLGLADRRRLHLMAADLVAEEGATLRHQASAARRAGGRLAELLTTYAGRLQVAGDREQAARALLEASRLSGRSEQREQRLLPTRSTSWATSATPVMSASSAATCRGSPSGPLRDATSGISPSCAAGAARRAISCTPPGATAIPMATRRSRRWSRTGWPCTVWRGCEAGKWPTFWRALALARPDDLLRVEAKALLGLGRCLLGRAPDEVAPVTRPDAGRVTTADGEPAVRAGPARTAQVTPHAGSLRIAVWAYVWLARTRFVAGAWDAAAADVQRPCRRWSSRVSVVGAAGRLTANVGASGTGGVGGSGGTRPEATSQRGGYELMVLAAALARAHVAWARDDHEAVLRALEPVVGMPVVGKA